MNIIRSDKAIAGKTNPKNLNPKITSAVTLSGSNIVHPTLVNTIEIEKKTKI